MNISTKTYQWPISTQKDVPCYHSLRTCKLKPQLEAPRHPPECSNHKEMTSVGKGAETPESLYVTDGNLKWYVGKTKIWHKNLKMLHLP